jgi:6-phosphogluconolactonase
MTNVTGVRTESNEAGNVEARWTREVSGAGRSKESGGEMRRFGMATLAVWALALGVTTVPRTALAQADVVRVYFGTYSEAGSQGIYVGKFDTNTGTVSDVVLAAEIKNPSFLAIHPSKKFLYAVSEVSDAGGKPVGSVAAFSINPDGKLTFLNAESSAGAGPCHVTLDKTGKTALAANYGGGSVCSMTVGDDGKVSPAVSVFEHKGSSVDKSRQEKSHAHSIYPDPTNQYAVSADLGLDQVLVYKMDAAKGTLVPAAVPFAKTAAGAGPRHFAFHPNGKFGYVINELGNTVTAFAWGADKGTLTEIQTLSTLPVDFTGKSYTAEVVVHPNGRFLYGSNRGYDSLAVFKVDEGSGKLTLLGQHPTKGKFPRNFNIDPSGKWVLCANQDTNNILVFKIDPATGHLSDTGHELKMGRPVCIKFLVP